MRYRIEQFYTDNQDIIPDLRVGLNKVGALGIEQADKNRTKIQKIMKGVKKLNINS